jgi:hypothetical protein
MRKLLIGLLFISELAYAAPTVTLTATPTTGISPLTVTLAWSSTGAVSCIASDGWSGSKPLNGTETVTGLTISKNFILTCSAADGSARLSWTAPTQNTDGSALTNLAGYKIYHATTSADVAAATPITVSDKTAVTYTITELPTGPRYYGIKAINTEGIMSVMSGLVNNVITIPATVANANVTVNVKPKPPVILTVEQVVYEVRENPTWGTMLGRTVGTVPLGTQCNAPMLYTNSGVYYEVPLDAVTLTRMPKSAVVVVKCETSG